MALVLLQVAVARVTVIRYIYLFFFVTFNLGWVGHGCCALISTDASLLTELRHCRVFCCPARVPI